MIIPTGTLTNLILSLKTRHNIDILSLNHKRKKWCVFYNGHSRWLISYIILLIWGQLVFFSYCPLSCEQTKNKVCWGVRQQTKTRAAHVGGRQDTQNSNRAGLQVNWNSLRVLLSCNITETSSDKKLRKIQLIVNNHCYLPKTAKPENTGY